MEIGTFDTVQDALTFFFTFDSTEENFFTNSHRGYRGHYKTVYNSNRGNRNGYQNQNYGNERPRHEHQGQGSRGSRYNNYSRSSYHNNNNRYHRPGNNQNYVRSYQTTTIQNSENSNHPHPGRLGDNM